jgi:ABC-type multidrug transport system fused ATPase/permease subunit
MLVVILNYTAKYLESAKKIAQTNYHFKQQLGQYDKLFDILTMNPMESTGHHPCKFQNKICYQDVYFAYEPDRGDILKGLNLEIQKGEWLGIMGHSGAGKTTVFDLLLRFYPPGSGTIAIDDVDIQTIDCLDLRSKITKVSQDTFLFPGSIRENLTIECPNATDIDLWRVLESVRLKDFIGRLADGLDTQIGENGLLLSGGERQRLGLAQGLLRNSEIILLDEVTANIDTEAENMIMRILYELKKERGLTIISISHRLEFLAYSDRITILENGIIGAETSYAQQKDK